MLSSTQYVFFKTRYFFTQHPISNTRMGKNIGFPCGTKINIFNLLPYQPRFLTFDLFDVASNPAGAKPVMKCNVYMSRNAKKIVFKSRKRELGDLYVEKKERFSTLKCLFRVPQRICKPKKHDNKNKHNTHMRQKFAYRTQKN